MTSDRTISRAGIALLILAGLFGLVAVAAFFAAIWAHGSELPDRLFGTGALSGFLAIVTGASGAMIHADS